MSLTITDQRITSDEVDAVAEFRPHAAADGKGAWVVFHAHHGDLGLFHGGRLFDRNQAISAMTLEEELARPHPDQALIASLESELS
jgi:hypothetical protein